MITVKVTKTNSNYQIPAEVRVVEKDVLTVLLKDFETATLIAKQFRKSSGNVWTTADGEYSCVVPPEILESQQVYIRVPKNSA